MAKIWACIKILIDPIDITCWINLGARKVTKFMAKIWACIKILIDPIAITCWINLGARKVTKFMAKIWACIKIFNWPKSYYLLIESVWELEKSPNLWQKYEPVLRFLIDPRAITCWINLGAKNVTKFMANTRFFIDCIHDFQI